MDNEEDSGLSQPADTNSENKMCWVCFVSETYGSRGWIRPCKCTGSTKWVHFQCLSDWIEEKFISKGIKPLCFVCEVEYNILMSKPGAFLSLLDVLDSFFARLSTVVGVTAITTAVYMSSFGWGSVMMWQVLSLEGYKEFVEANEILTCLAVIPALPAASIFVNCLLRWAEDYVLEGLRYIGPKIPIMHKVLPAGIPGPGPKAGVRAPEELSLTRSVVGGFLLPTFATFFGNVFFTGVGSPLPRACYGGLVFLSSRMLFSMYLKQNIYRVNRRIRILSHDDHERTINSSEEPTSEYTTIDLISSEDGTHLNSDDESSFDEHSIDS